MTTVKLRTSVLAEIASIMDNEEMMKKALSAIRKLKKAQTAPPCQFTVDELKREIELAEEDDRNNRYCTSEELRRKHMPCQ